MSTSTKPRLRFTLAVQKIWFSIEISKLTDREVYCSLTTICTSKLTERRWLTSRLFVGRAEKEVGGRGDRLYNRSLELNLSWRREWSLNMAAKYG